MNTSDIWFIPSAILNARRDELALVLTELAKMEEEFEEKKLFGLRIALAAICLVCIALVLAAGDITTNEEILVVSLLGALFCIAAYLIGRQWIFSNRAEELAKVYWEITALPFNKNSIILWDSLLSQPKVVFTPKMAHFVKKPHFLWDKSGDIFSSEGSIQNMLGQIGDWLSPQIYEVNTGLLSPQSSELPNIAKYFIPASGADAEKALILKSAKSWTPQTISAFINNYRHFLQSHMPTWVDTIGNAALDAGRFAAQRLQSFYADGAADIEREFISINHDAYDQIKGDIANLYDQVIRPIEKELASPTREIERQKNDKLKWANTKKDDRLTQKKQNVDLELANLDWQINNIQARISVYQSENKKIHVNAKKLLKKKRDSHEIDFAAEIGILEKQIENLRNQRLASSKINNFEFSLENQLNVLEVENSLRKKIEDLEDLKDDNDDLQRQIHKAGNEIATLEMEKRNLQDSLNNTSRLLDASYESEAQDIAAEAEERIKEHHKSLTDLRMMRDSFIKSAADGMQSPALSKSSFSISEGILNARKKRLQDLLFTVKNNGIKLQALHKKERENVKVTLWNKDFLSQVPGRYLVPFWIMKRAQKQYWEVLMSPSWGSTNSPNNTQASQFSFANKMPGQAQVLNECLRNKEISNQFMTASVLSNRALMANALITCERFASNTLITRRLLARIQQRLKDRG